METYCRKSESVAFNPEYNKQKPVSAIRTDLLSYLAEYRFHVDFDYELLYSGGYLRDIHEREPLILKTQRAIEKRIKNGDTTNRELNEHEGIALLDRSLLNAHTGDMILWASPPGSKKDNYGDYGYFFKGIIDWENGGEKHIKMSALRIKRTDMQSYNEVISDVTGYPCLFHNADEFLAHPMVLHAVKKDAEKVILERFGRQSELNDRFKLSMQVLEPLIKEFLNAVQRGEASEELKKIFYSIENLAIQIKENTMYTDHYSLIRTLLIDPRSVITKFGSYRAPFAKGSCGGTSKSTNILDESNFIKKLLGEEVDGDEFGSLTFMCGVCGEQHRRPPHQLLTECPKYPDVEMEKC